VLNLRFSNDRHSFVVGLELVNLIINELMIDRLISERCI